MPVFKQSKPPIHVLGTYVRIVPMHLFPSIATGGFNYHHGLGLLRSPAMRLGKT
jgi:hypothetical protein